MNTELSLEDARFEWPNGESVLNGASLTLPRGRVVGLSGSNGSGKTTLVHLLSRRYPLTQGRLRVDHVDGSSIDLHDYRNAVRVVPGTVKIFEDTERYWALMLDRVGQMAKDGKSPNQIKAELRMPEYEHWGSKDRFSTNVQAAFEAICSPRAMQRIFPDDPARLLSNRGTRCRIP